MDTLTIRQGADEPLLITGWLDTNGQTPDTVTVVAIRPGTVH